MDKVEILDVRGTHCPVNFATVKVTLEKMKDGETLKVLIDCGDPVKKVTQSLKGDGHKVIKAEKQDDGEYFILYIVKNGRNTEERI